MDRGRQTPSPLHCHRVLAGILQVSPTSRLLPNHQMLYCTRVEAVDPLKLDPTSMSNIYKVIDMLHMQWIEEDRPHCHRVLAGILQVSPTSRLLPNHRMLYCTRVEAVDPLQLDPTSMSNIYKVIDMFHMQWIEEDRPHHHSTFSL